MALSSLASPSAALDDLVAVSPAATPAQEPIRAELFGQARFEAHARRLAAAHEVQTGRSWHADAFFPRLTDNLAVLQRAHALLDRRARSGRHIGPSGQWLLDNGLLLHEQMQVIRAGISRAFFRRLPRLRDEPLAGLPRIYGVVWAFVAHTDSLVDERLLQPFLAAYELERPLTLTELWALSTTLRAVLIENLRRLAERTVATLAARDAAHQWFDGPEALRTEAELDRLQAELEPRGVADSFWLQLEQRQDDLPYERCRDLMAWLTRRLPHAADAEARLQARANEDQQSIRNVITSLRGIERIDWRRLFGRISSVMQVLGRCPVHAAESEQTQDATLKAVERLARRSRIEEVEVAELLLELTRRAADADDARGAPAWWWGGPGERVLRQALALRPRRWPQRGSQRLRRLATVVYLPLLALATLGSVAWLLDRHADPLAPGWMLALTALLLLAPASETVVATVNRLIAESLQPRPLPRLALADGLPPEHRCLVVVPALLSSPDTVQALLQQLEQHHLANPETQAQFALLSDGVDADTAERPGDAALLEQARAGVAALNARHPGGSGEPARFLLLHRGRRFSASEGRFIGWERKRGKLEQLILWLADGGASPFADLGALSQPAPGVRYLLTLDSDTDLPPGRLRALVAVAAHPCNQPQLDAAGRRVAQGYGILQPRVATPLPIGETITAFHAMFAGQTGVDPYSAASSELYQDLFGEGTYTGKGLIHIAAARAVLVQRLPEEQVLSHDLVEGNLARCAGVSDITVLEDAPLHADVAAARLHRWTRGDWQLLPLLARAGRDGVPMIDRWKMVDNLRRSLVAPLSVLLLLWVGVTGTLGAGWALAVVAMAYGAGPVLGALAGLAPSRDDLALRPFFRVALGHLGRALAAPLWHLAMLLDQALMYGDAIVRALYRHRVSRRLLLQWTTAAAAQAAASTELKVLLRQHRRTVWVASAAAVVAGAAAVLGLPVQGLLLAPLLLLWAAAPVWVWLASRPRPRPQRERLDAAAQAYLRDLSRDTWRLYERHVGEADHHLPPDNVQMQPVLTVAHRTSPTNIGLYLLATACARRLGFIGRADLAERLGATLDTLERLPRHRGHLYNWYDTRTLAVLPPAYVSTVDSGNASAHLLAVASACEEAAAEPAGTMAALFSLALAASSLRLRPLLPMLAAAPSLGALAAVSGPFNGLPTDDAGFEPWPARLAAARRELDDLNLGRNGQDETGPLWLLHDHLGTLESLLRDRRADDAALRATLLQHAGRARRLALEPDFGCLYDARRGLLHIGLRTDGGQLDHNHYDLLASEARLASLVAIAKGDVPPAHWGMLGRPFYGDRAQVGLKSWSGSMFEYLMPSLVVDEPAGSVLAHATRAAVHEQRTDAQAHGTPWGVSESAIAARDHSLDYQYGPQGVPRLALRRTPVDERVVTPYATALAALVSPAAAVANLRQLEALGARRALGFVEALDYSPQRQTEGSSFVLVHTFMAHHQAMSLVAFADLLTDGAPRRWGRSDPHLRAVSPLLHEAPPRELPRLRHIEPPPASTAPRRAHLTAELNPLQETLPATQLLGNGSHAVWLRSHGGGVSRWQGVALTRWRDDLLRDSWGSFVYVERAGSPQRHSITSHPAPDPQARYQVRLQPDRAVFDARWPDLQARCAVWVSPEDDCELRTVELVNPGSVPLELVVSWASEVTLAPPGADEAHPAFSNLFVRAHWDAEDQALYTERRPRLEGEPSTLAAFFLGASAAEIIEVTAVADRSRWQGRYLGAGCPSGDAGLGLLPAAADGPDGSLPGRAVDTGLDPVAVIRVRLFLPAGSKASLSFGLVAARTLDPLVALVDKYQHAAHVQRASNMSYTMAGIRLREMQLGADSWRALLRLQTLLTSTATRDLPTRHGGWRCERRLLWRHAIAGDRPLLLVTISDEGGLPLVQLLKKALRGWSAAGLGVDLVVVNAEPASYLMPVQRQLLQLRERQLAQLDERWPVAQRCAMHVLREAEVGADEMQTLQALARARLSADGRTLAQQVERLVDELFDAPRAASPPPLRLPRPALPAPATVAPQGRFDEEGAFQFRLDEGHAPQRPWINVLANPSFGCQVSEVGAGMTWALNSRQHPITPWSNDPLVDPAGEWLLLHDRDSGQLWCLGRAAADEGTAVTQGIGYTRLVQVVDGLQVGLTWCVDVQHRVKQLHVQLRNTGLRRRRLRLVAVAEWQLGAGRGDRQSVQTVARPVAPAPQGVGLPVAAPTTVLMATQLDPGAGFGGSTAFLAWRGPVAGDDWTCDRSECFDSCGQTVLPRQLGRRSGLGLDPCAALGITVDLGPQGQAEAAVLLGHADDARAAASLAAQALAVEPALRLEQQRAHWRQLNGAVQVRTPDPAFDALVNHWLPYQTVACRLWARAGFYQAGGAFGFRDQLQDAMSMINHEPALLAAQIRVHAARQFPQGDVQHWWHEPGGAGVRTRFSDDLLWLPAALALYVERTGDAALLDERVPFIDGSAVPADREDVYEVPRAAAEEAATLYEHAARAIDHSLPVGDRGLPLMGTGDWNDGMNRVGSHGRGQSVWLAWFLCDVVDRCLPLAQARGDAARVAAWTRAREGWVRALDSQAWDGRWYRRAYFDDGTPLGTEAAHECRIDLIAQAWAVLSGAGQPERATLALRSATDLLYDEPHAVLALLTPPLQHQRPSAGYIQAYPPGVRENGGQYNHAAVWALMAAARLGQAPLAWRIFQAVSPAHRWQDRTRGQTYALEPYVLAGDIYGAAPWAGRGGWSWYSGSAGWLLRAAVESICGATLAQGVLQLRPCLPPGWREVVLSLRHQGHTHRVLLCDGEAAVRAGLLREPQAGLHPLHLPLVLAGRNADSVTVVDVAARSGDDAARQHQLEQRALVVLRSPDE